MSGETNRITCSYDPAVQALLNARKRKVLIGMYDEMGFDLRDYNIDKIISMNEIQDRNMFIRKEYNKCRAQGIKSEALIVELAAKWYVSYDTIYKVVHAKDVPK